MSENRYEGAAGRAYQEGKRAIPAQALPWVAALRASKIQTHVRPADVVVELGAGLGWNLAALVCARRIGTDLSDHLAPELARLGIEFRHDASGLPDGAADVVLCHHVLEHVPAPLDLLGEAGRLLKPAGILLAHVPFEKERRYRRYDPQEPNHHLYSWNAQTLGNLVSDAGFQVTSVGIGEFGYDRFAACWAARGRLGQTGFRMIRAMAHLLSPGREVRLTAVPCPAATAS